LKKNIVIITIDGARLDRAKNSNIFNKNKSIFLSQCITYGPHTIASMHAIFSGCYGSRTGTNSYWSTYKFKKDQFHTLTEYLKNEGYFTYADVHSEIVLPKQGFDKFIIYDEDTNLIERHVKLLENISVEQENNNFFLYLHYDKIHSSIIDSVLKKYTNFSKEYFENRQENNSKYDELFHNSELYLEIILNKIYELKLFDNSIIVILSDHGISTGEKFGERAYGAFCYDYTLKTFCYFYDSELKPKEISQQVRTVDFMPTILELLKIPLNKNFEDLDGESLYPLFTNQKLEEKFAYSETGNPLDEKSPPKEPNTKSIRTSNWKLIYNEYNNSKELYNLKNDPNEEKNLINMNLKIEKILWSELQKNQQN
jgi:arylsulfatase A-like enzyme